MYSAFVDLFQKKQIDIDVLISTLVENNIVYGEWYIGKHSNMSIGYWDIRGGRRKFYKLNGWHHMMPVKK